jgi:hypothetical protein
MSKKARDAKWMRRYMARLDRQALEFARERDRRMGVIRVEPGETWKSPWFDVRGCVVGVDWGKR